MAKALNLRCPALPLVRIALVGLGQRGMKTLKRYAYISGAEIRAVADLSPERVKAANAALALSGRPQAQELWGDEAWLRACRLPDVDLIYICTEWGMHTPIAVEAMRCGKHVAVEVPAATTVSECRQLVQTAEETQRHCFMTENCCYDLFTLQTLEMHRLGLLGEITHCEGAYIHDLTRPSRQTGGQTDTRRNWMERACEQHGGNPYPTHGIGPIGRLLGFHRHDRMVSLTAITSRGVACGETVRGCISNALIRTERGVSILLQLDVTTPRPYSRLQTVCGTRGFVQKYPLPAVQLFPQDALTGDEALAAMQKYATSPEARLWHEGHSKGVENEMNYAMDARLVHCLRNGLPLDIDVYDAAEWSCLAELTQTSARSGGAPVEIPSFL